MNTRLIIALILAMLVMIFFQFLFVKKPQKEVPASKETVVAEKGEEKAGLEAESPLLPQEQQQPREGVAYQDVVVDTPLYTATFSTYGGRLKSWKLKHYMDKVPMHPLGKFVQNMVGGILGRKKVDETPPQPVDIITTTGLEEAPLGIRFRNGSIGYDEGIPYVPSSKRVILSREGEDKTLSLYWRSPSGGQIEKKFRFYADTYRMDMEVIVSNPAKRSSTKDMLALEWTALVREKKSWGGFSGPIYYADGAYHTIKKPKKIKEEGAVVQETDWFGFNQYYFIALIYPSIQGTSLMLRRTLKMLYTAHSSPP